MKKDQRKTPIFDALVKYVQDDITPFHMPGHKKGKGAAKKVTDFLGRNFLAIDVTGVEGMDDLHEPQGIIKEAQELAAEAFGSDRSFFLINGTSSGIHAMILTACNPGDKIIIPRNAHRSIVSGVILAGAKPVYMQPEVDEEMGIAMGVTPETVEATLKEHPDAKAVMIINPTYYGVTTDLAKIVEIVHRYDKLVLVDEAHGPHLYFHPDLPITSMEAGADICAQGIHKIIGGMTQASMLHIREGRVDIARLKGMLRLVQSTSTSYLLLNSLDTARMQMATEGKELLTNALALAEQARQRINAIPGLSCFGQEITGVPGRYDLDATKLTITVKDLGFTGQEVELILRYDYGIQVELADLYNVLCIISIGDTQEDVDKLINALEDMIKTKTPDPENPEFFQELKLHGQIPPIPKQIMTPRNALFASTQTIPLEEAEEHISAEVIASYPPGIPIICPGEEFTKEIIEYLQLLREAGIRIQGPQDASLETIKVVKEWYGGDDEGVINEE